MSKSNSAIIVNHMQQQTFVVYENIEKALHHIAEGDFVYQVDKMFVAERSDVKLVDSADINIKQHNYC